MSFNIGEYFNTEKNKDPGDSNNETTELNTEAKELNNEPTIELQLADIIQISAPKNDNLNDQIFIIDYIDKTKIKLINTESMSAIKLDISPEGYVGDGTIEKISILSRSKHDGYAKQNNLVPNTWIDIHFSGDFPAVITGEITNLENDMIEIKTVDNDILYINFDYKGIPEDIPISFIEIRDKPKMDDQGEREEGEREEGEREEGEKDEGVEVDATNIDVEKGEQATEINVDVPVDNIKNQIREFILKGNQIKFGHEELGPIVQYMDVATKYTRYSIEDQVSEMMDDLLSTIPNNQRTNRVLTNIHRIIERFKQLRTRFSTFDEYGNVDGRLVYEARYKPLLEYFEDYKHNLYWLMPVVKNVKKLYNVSLDENSENDIVNLKLTDDLEEMKEIYQKYKSNEQSGEDNKYVEFNVNMNYNLTPFNELDVEVKNTDTLIDKHVGDDINVIIDNLEDMYSTVYSNSDVRNRRFVITKYNLGMSKLDTLDTSGSKMISTRVSMVPSDRMSIKSIMTLPEPTVRFSKINLSNTNILERANLNRIFLEYWQFLNKRTKVNNIIVEDIDNDLRFNENNFVNNIKNYVLALPEDTKNRLSKEEIYYNFVKTIVPKTKIIFTLMKKYIKGKLSIVDVVSYLEPFLIYTDNLTYMQYKEIVHFIHEEISKNNKNFIERGKTFIRLNNIKSANINFANAYDVISMITSDKTRDEVFNAYNMKITQPMTKSNSELLCDLNKNDARRLLTSAISLQNLVLSFPSEFTNLLTDEKNAISNMIDNDKDDSCKSIVIAKQYNSLNELENDNNVNIYFDKKYDKTKYDLLDNYESQLLKMSSEEFAKYLLDEFKNKFHLSEENAEYLMKTLLDGKKKVINGQYAVLIKETANNDVTSNSDVSTNGEVSDTEYYVRKNNKWEVAKDVPTESLVDDEQVMCNIQKDCISTPTDDIDSNNKCNSMRSSELNIQHRLMTTMLNEFDSNYNLTKEQLTEELTNSYNYCLVNIEKLEAIRKTNQLKYNNYKYKLGNIEDREGEQIVSPYSQLLNLILRQGDFVKKQQDIIRFVNIYTRQPVTIGLGPLNKKESVHWLYCKKTNLPILPIFKYNMAVTYIKTPNNYQEYIAILISTIGKLSDNGDSYIDENSGWVIQKIEDDYDEGYDGGFKVSSREIMEDAAGDKINLAKTTMKYDTLETKTISNIVNALSVAIGVNLESQKEFIINGVLDVMKTTVESEEDYKLKIKKMAEANKKVMSYETFYNTAMLFYTLGMILIAIQTSIPSIKTRKTHPGCVRSFKGYPFEGNGDYSSVEYIACIAYDIKSSADPWNALKNKKREYIFNKIKSTIDNFLMGLWMVKEKIDLKTEYLLLNEKDEIADEYSLAKWTTFLPPLVPFHLKNVTNVTSDFTKSLLSEMKHGNITQDKKLNTILSKIMLFSLGVQEKIQHVVDKEELLLVKANNEKYIENACCETNDDTTTIGYFMNKSSDIKHYADIVGKLTDTMNDIDNITKSKLLYSTIDTKNKYPEISNIFDEKIIYLSFIKFCKFNSYMETPEYLKALCSEKPDKTLIDINSSIDEIIVKLKQDGREYTYDNFLRLIQNVSKHNIINTSAHHDTVSEITKFRGFINSLIDEKDDNIDNKLLGLFLNLTDTFDVASHSISDETKALNNYLATQNTEMKQEIISFLKQNKGGNISNKQLKNVISVVDNIDGVIENNRDFKKYSNNIINFYKNTIHNLVDVFPNIILNNVDYNNVVMKKYLNLSKTHVNKIKTMVSEYYKPLREQYSNNEITSILYKVQQDCHTIELLSTLTPTFSTIDDKRQKITPIYDERTSIMIFIYYTLKILHTYVSLSQESDMVVTEVAKNDVEEDLITAEYYDEGETKVDFMETADRESTQLIKGNVKLLKQKTVGLLVNYLTIINNDKEIVDITYESISDKIFKLKDKEKDVIRSRLTLMTDEERNIDTMMKVNKLGMWGKGMEKGLTQYVKETYDEEEDFRNKMMDVENKLRRKNVQDEDLDDAVEDYLEEENVTKEIEAEEYDMRNMTSDYDEGNWVDFDPDENGEYY